MMVTELRPHLSHLARGSAKQEGVMKRTSKLFSGSMLAVVVATTLASSPAFATSEAEARAACTGDVFRYCVSAIPNLDRIIVCLRGQKEKISKPCQAVLSANGH
jgi:hypothetical protein